MYEFVDLKWNPLSGACLHGCSYCSTKAFLRYPACAKKYSGDPAIDARQIGKNLGKDNLVFVCSQNDLFAKNIPLAMIDIILSKCRKHDNTYFFQTKDPERMAAMVDRFRFPEKSIFCCTIESNRHYPEIMGQDCPTPIDRFHALLDYFSSNCQITIEPMLDFDLDLLLSWLIRINPNSINIGSDSKSHHLPEPSKEKLLSLIHELGKFTEVHRKDNLKRLLI
jgi:DNA repair photolyase